MGRRRWSGDCSEDSALPVLRGGKAAVIEVNLLSPQVVEWICRMKLLSLRSRYLRKGSKREHNAMIGKMTLGSDDLLASTQQQVQAMLTKTSNRCRIRDAMGGGQLGHAA
jgi:hypothetical protein